MQSSVAEELVQVVENASERLRRLSDSKASLKPAPGQWSKKEILGHLIDSGVNNHHCFIRAQQVEEFIFAGYEQDHWVSHQD